MVFPIKDRYLLVHGLSGAVKLVSKESAQDFFDGKITEELKPFFTHMTPGEEQKSAQSLCDFLMKKKAPYIDNYIAVTYDCNLRCPYCCEIGVKHPETMKTVINEHTVDKAFEALEFLNKDYHKKPLTITGGEPLMKKNKDIVTYILKKGDNLGYSLRIFTNGVELNHFLDIISSVNTNYLQITLDGPRHLHDKRRIFRKQEGTFDIIVRNIEEARKRGIPLLIRTNTDAEILSHLDELGSFFKEKEWITDKNITFSLAYTCDRYINPSKFEEQTRIYEGVMDVAEQPEMSFFEAHPHIKLQSLFYEHPKFWPSFWNCNAARTMYALDPFGDIYPCPSMLGWKKGCTGSYIPDLSFNKMHEQWQKRTLFTLDACTACEIALVCGGGCGYAALLNNGDLFKPVCTSSKRVTVSCLQHLYEMRNNHEPALNDQKL